VNPWYALFSFTIILGLTVPISQNHLLELKLAAIQSLEYEDFFALFGVGKHPAFRSLLDSKIAPYLSSAAYQFWKRHSNTFASSFYINGFGRRALSGMRILLSFAGPSKGVIAPCNSDTLVEQESIWRAKLRSAVLGPALLFFLRSPFFYWTWNALGIPLSQRKMLLKDGKSVRFHFSLT
jgi:betaine lipid synthase